MWMWGTCILRSSWLINNACPNWYKVDINYFILSMNINFHTIFIHPVPCAKRASELNDVYEIYIPPWTKLLGYTGFGLSCTHWAWITQENFHYIDVTMTTMVSQITSLTVVYSIVYSGVDQRKHQSSASLAFVRGIHRDRWIPSTKGQ